MGALASEPFLVHNVYFSLKDNSTQGKKILLDACAKYLTGHPGTVFYGAGLLAEELKRPINDRDFDVALSIVFETPAAHNEYQVSARHLKFIEENKVNWQNVRVFDSKVQK